MEWLQLFGVFGVLAISGGTPSNQSSSYLISFSKVIRPGIPTTLSVTILGETPVLVTSEIIHGGTSVVTTQNTIQGGSTQLLILPPIPDSNSSYWYPYELLVKGYVGSKMLFTNTTLLSFSPKSMSILLQTDKPNYKPGQGVKIHAVTFQPNGKPFKGQIDIVIKDPKGNMIGQWLRLDSVLGVVSKEFQLSDNPLLGIWKIVATDGEVVQEREFNVDQYVLPKFEVQIIAPSILHYEETLTGTVTAWHFHGKPVQGHVVLSYVHGFHGIDALYEETKVIDGEVEFSFEVPVLFHEMSKRSKDDTYQNYKGYMNSEYVDITVLVTESLTGLTYDSRMRVIVVKSKYNLEFRAYPSIIRPSLNFTAELRLSTYNKQPLSAEDPMKMVTLSVSQHRRSPWSWRWDDEGLLSLRRPSSSSPNDSMQPTGTLPHHPLHQDFPVQVLELPVPSSGIIPFHIQLTDSIGTLTIDAEFEDGHKRLQLYSSYTSPSQSYIQLHRTNTAQVGHRLHLTVESNFPLSTFHYLVMSRGQVVAAGTKSSATFTLTPDQSWAPQACVLVYCVQPDGEIINDVLHVPIVSQVLKNNVTLSWGQQSAMPGEGVSLSVSVSEPHSLVGILVVDKATGWTETGNGISEKRVIEELAEFSNAMSWPALNEIKMGDPYSVFMECSVMVLTDASLNKEMNHLAPEFPGEVPLLVQVESHGEKGPRERKDFPETWLWLDVNTSDSTATQIPLMVPDSITTWVAHAFVMSEGLGLGVSAPEELTVFQDFFLSLNLPYSIIRGEVLLLQINLFNYMEEDVEVMVIVAESDMFDFVSPEDEEELPMAKTQRVVVWGLNGTSVFIPIRATALGEIPISVKAISSYVTDTVHRTIFVKSEGVQQSFTRTLFLEFLPRQTTLMQEIFFSFPPDLVQGSQRATVTAIGDILGPSISGLETLIQMPSGCGEQNMINFAPNIYVLHYLINTGQADEKTRQRAIKHMMKGYEQELSYQRFDGSFSAFGDSDSSGSTWLTAFVLRCFLQARPFMSVDPEVIMRTANWLGAQQGPDGAFLEPGQVIHSELQGGLEGPVSLTAYVLMALVEDTTYRSMYERQVSAALSYLQTKLAQGISSNYSLSLVSYALSLAQGSDAQTAVTQLLHRADVQDGVPVWRSSNMWLADFWQPRSAEVEMAAYALLALYKLGNVADGFSLMKWLSQQRNHLGGYGSTQDTVIALQALSMYASLSSSDLLDLNIVVRTPVETAAIFEINKSNYLLLQSQEIELEEELHLQVSAEGRGFALFQLTTFYNVESEGLSRERRHGNMNEAFELHIDVMDSDLYNMKLSICTRLWEDQGLSQTGMAILEVGLLSGFSLNGAVTNHLIRKVETPVGKVVLYFDSVTTEEMCVVIPVILEFKVAGVRDAMVVIYDYYEPRRRTVRTYTSDLRRDMSSCSLCGNECSQCGGPEPYISSSIPLTHQRHHVVWKLVWTLFALLTLCL